MVTVWQTAVFSWIRRICLFSAVFMHFPSNYYVDPRNIIFVIISAFWVTRNQMETFIKPSDYQGCQIAWYFSLIWLFFCGFKHFPSIYNHLDFRNMIPLAIPLSWGTENLMVMFRKLFKGYQTCPTVRYFSWIQIFFASFKHFPFWLLEHESCGITHALGTGGDKEWNCDI